jgi:AraC-like DNA-binding protein
MSLQRTEYYRSNLLAVRYVKCRSAGKAPGSLERTDCNSLILPLRGIFLEHFAPREEILAEPNVALILRAGCLSRVSHPIANDDDCLVADFSAECFEEMAQKLPGHRSNVQALLSPSAMALRNLAWMRLERGFSNGLETEETALSLLHHALRGSAAGRASKGRISRQVETARVLLLTHAERRWSLEVLSRNLGCSPYHLTRAFRQQLGVPLHRYQLYARLAKSIDLLLQGADLTSVAMDLGFSSHSHFTATFRSYVGFSPSRIRDAANARTAGEVRKNLIALLS